MTFYYEPLLVIKEALENNPLEYLTHLELEVRSGQSHGISRETLEMLADLPNIRQMKLRNSKFNSYNAELISTLKTYVQEKNYDLKCHYEPEN